MNELNRIFDTIDRCKTTTELNAISIGIDIALGEFSDDEFTDIVAHRDIKQAEILLEMSGD